MNIKALIEKRAALVNEAQGIIETCETEARAMNEEESAKYVEIFEEIRKLGETIDANNKLQGEADIEVRKVEEPESEEVLEYRAFEEFLRSEMRTNNLTPASGSGQVLIPKTIANKIIAKVYDICPILEKSTKYNVKGTLEIPYYDESTTAITVAYQAEFNSLGSNVGAFSTVELTGYLAGALALVSRSLINNAQFPIVEHVVNFMAYSIKRFIEKELLVGTPAAGGNPAKVLGLSGITQYITAASASAITADEVVQLQDKVKDEFQEGAMWIMSPATRTALRLLQDNNGHYLLNSDISSPFGSTLLGKPVYVSDNMPDIATGKAVIYYGDPSGLATKFNEEISIDVLRERYADQHAVGVIAWFEFDGKVENQQKWAKLVMA